MGKFRVETEHFGPHKVRMVTILKDIVETKPIGITELSTPMNFSSNKE